MNCKNEGQNWSLLERALMYKLYLEQNGAKSKLQADKLLILDKALELFRLPSSISNAAISFDEFPASYEDFVLITIFQKDLAALSRVLFKCGYRPRHSFMATQNAIQYLNEFPSSPASTLLGGRPFKSSNNQRYILPSNIHKGYTPTLNIRELIQNINRCVPKGSSAKGISTFDLESLLLKVNYIFVTREDEGSSIYSVEEDIANYADPQNVVTQNFESLILELSQYYDILIDVKGIYSYIEHANEYGIPVHEIDRLRKELESLYKDFVKKSKNQCKEYPLNNKIFTHDEADYYRDLSKTKPYDDIESVVCVPENSSEVSHLDLLGRYLPGQNTILLWVDKIRALGDIKELVFQKVLLHECIHALLDIKRQTIKNYSNEETVDNSWVLYAYSNCVQSGVINEVIDFISNQPKEYKKALEMYPWMVDKNNQLYILRNQTRKLLSMK